MRKSPSLEQTPISIHAPRGGSDQLHGVLVRYGIDFNPRSPWGERLFLLLQLPQRVVISIHAPRGGSDLSHAIY